jgi:hypothetical protein
MALSNADTDVAEGCSKAALRSSTDLRQKQLGTVARADMQRAVKAVPGGRVSQSSMSPRIVAEAVG